MTDMQRYDATDYMSRNDTSGYWTPVADAEAAIAAAEHAALRKIKDQEFVPHGGLWLTHQQIDLVVRLAQRDMLAKCIAVVERFGDVGEIQYIHAALRALQERAK